MAREHGKFVSFERWTPKRSIKYLNSVIKQTGTFNKNVFREVISKKTGTVEYIDYRTKPARPYGRAEKIQYVISGTLPDGSVITARSQQHDIYYSKENMRDEAYESFLERLAQSQNLSYDADEGKKVLDMIGKDIRIREGYVYYVFKKDQSY